MKELRLGIGMTMKQVANSANISESMYCLIENGNRRPSPEVAQRIGDVLKFDWTRFYRENGFDSIGVMNETEKEKVV